MLLGIFSLGLVEMIIIGAVLGAIVGGVIYIFTGSGKDDE